MLAGTGLAGIPESVGMAVPGPLVVGATLVFGGGGGRSWSLAQSAIEAGRV